MALDTHTPAVATIAWIPSMVRRAPDRPLVVRYQVPGEDPPADAERRVAEALRRLKLTVQNQGRDTWCVPLAGHTLVYGLIRREVDETGEISLGKYPEGSELVVHCLPLQTHNAHAAGLGGVLLIASVAWLVGGITGGLLPALTTVLAGGLVVDVTRQWAFDALERRLTRIATDIGSALWPRAPAQLAKPNAVPRTTD